jgi:hypothetical protein
MNRHLTPFEVVLGRDVGQNIVEVHSHSTFMFGRYADERGAVNFCNFHDNLTYYLPPGVACEGKG